MWKGERKLKIERCKSSTKMKWKRKRNRKKCIMRNEVVWKRERNAYIKLKRVGRDNMKHKLTGTTSP